METPYANAYRPSDSLQQAAQLSPPLACTIEGRGERFIRTKYAERMPQQDEKRNAEAFVLRVPLLAA